MKLMMESDDAEITTKHGLRALKIFKNTIGLDHIAVSNTYANIAFRHKEEDEEKYLNFIERAIYFNSSNANMLF